MSGDRREPGRYCGVCGRTLRISELFVCTSCEQAESLLEGKTQQSTKINSNSKDNKSTSNGDSKHA